jgi:hypothetical protein
MRLRVNVHCRALVASTFFIIGAASELSFSFATASNVEWKGACGNSERRSPPGHPLQRSVVGDNAKAFVNVRRTGHVAHGCHPVTVRL